MTTVHFVALPTAIARSYQTSGPDAYGQSPEVRVCDGPGAPCRHCLREIAIGEEYLVLAHRPFDALHAYAETGPIFVHARACERYHAGNGVPEILDEGRREVLIRGYDAAERIIYGTGAITPTERVVEATEALLESAEVAFVHVRSAGNNCFLCRIERG